MTDPRAATRPKKFGHLDTIQYEIDMLNYCKDRLLAGKWPNQASYYLCIEGFLLHYRNLSEFFGSKKDLKALEPEVWSPQKKLTDAQLASIQNARLDDKYTGQISQYLSHCTKSRAERDRDWNIVEMYGEVEPCIENFRKIFPHRNVTL